jgi:hypothetical protein
VADEPKVWDKEVLPPDLGSAAPPKTFKARKLQSVEGTELVLEGPLEEVTIEFPDGSTVRTVGRIRHTIDMGVPVYEGEFPEMTMTIEEWIPPDERKARGMP